MRFPQVFLYNIYLQDVFQLYRKLIIIIDRFSCYVRASIRQHLSNIIGAQSYKTIRRKRLTCFSKFISTDPQK